jgi:acyl-coenzyme A thioesterase 9
VKEVKPVMIKDISRFLLNMVDTSTYRTGGESEEFLPICDNQSACPVRCMKDSYQEVIIPLGSDLQEREKYINFMGGIRFGRILENLDVFAWWVCHMHNQNPANGDKIFMSRLSTVTAGVDRIELHHDNASISAEKDVKMSGHVTWVGRSSMEVTMNVEQEDADGKMQEKLTARFVMAARNPMTQKGAVVNPLKPCGELEERLFKQGAENKKTRLEEASHSLLLTVPDEHERHTIHDLFKRTVDTKSGTFRVKNAPDNSIWMADTKLKNLILCHPEQKNAYHKMFGGFLMRQAFELAWANAAMYCKGRPMIKIVSDIQFRKPVEIGSLLFLSSRVVYTSGSVIQNNVHASVIDPTTGIRDSTNNFYFVFETGRQDLPQVIPHSYAEAMLYLDGMRHL